jgi:hypothetical protein
MNFWYCDRQQGGIIVAGPGKGNISYIHKVMYMKPSTPIFIEYIFLGIFTVYMFNIFYDIIM